MQVFTVTKPEGITDLDFRAYTGLLEEIGLDVDHVPRVPEPGTQRRWLYAWSERDYAENFAQEMRRRTRDTAWQIQASEIEAEDWGPVAPLDIFATREPTIIRYWLSPASRERVNRHFPHTTLYPVEVSHETLQGIKEQFGEGWRDQICISVTGLSKEKVLSLGGYRLIRPDGRIEHEELPEISHA